MRVQLHQYKFLFDRIVADVKQDKLKLLILPSLSSDSIASTKIICELLKNQNIQIPYQVIPIDNYDEAIYIVQSTLEQDPSQGLSVICLDHSGGVDVRSVYQVEEYDNVYFTIIDSHRPFHLHNLNRNNTHVRVVLDSLDNLDDINELIPIDILSDDEVFFYDADRDSDDYDDYVDNDHDDDDEYMGTDDGDYLDDVNDDEEEDIEDIENPSRRADSRTAHHDKDDDDEDENIDVENLHANTLLQKGNKSSYNDPDAKSGDISDDDPQQPTSQDTLQDGNDDSNIDADDDGDEVYNQSQHSQRSQEELSLEEDTMAKPEQDSNHDQDETPSDNDHEHENLSMKRKSDVELSRIDTSTLKRKRKRKQKQPKPPPKPRRLSAEEIHAIYNRDQISIQVLRQRQQQYYRLHSYASPTAITTWALSRSINQASQFIWCAIIGLTESYQLEKLPFAFYQRFYSLILHEVNVAATAIKEIKRETRRTLNNMHNSNVKEENHADDIETVYNRDEAELAVEFRLTSDGILQNDELIFPFVRHWNLFDAMTHCSLVNISLELWKETGVGRLKTVCSMCPYDEVFPIILRRLYARHFVLVTLCLPISPVLNAIAPPSHPISFPFHSSNQLLAKLPIPLDEAKKSYRLFTNTSKNILLEKISIYGGDLQNITTPTFVRKFGQELIANAIDVVYAILAVLHNCGNENLFFPKAIATSPSNQDSNQNEQDLSPFQRSNTSFWACYDLLSHALNTASLRNAIDLAIRQVEIVVTQTIHMIKLHQVNTVDPVHHALINSNNILEVSFLCNHVALSSLAFRLSDVLSLTKVSKPLILGIVQPHTDYILAVGVNPVPASAEGRALKTTLLRRRSYSQFQDLFGEAAFRIQADVLQNAFDTTTIFVRKTDWTKFIEQVIFMVSTDRSIRRLFNPPM